MKFSRALSTPQPPDALDCASDGASSNASLVSNPVQSPRTCAQVLLRTMYTSAHWGATVWEEFGDHAVELSPPDAWDLECYESMVALSAAQAPLRRLMKQGRRTRRKLLTRLHDLHGDTIQGEANLFWFRLKGADAILREPMLTTSWPKLQLAYVTMGDALSLALLDLGPSCRIDSAEGCKQYTTQSSTFTWIR